MVAKRRTARSAFARTDRRRQRPSDGQAFHLDRGQQRNGTSFRRRRTVALEAAREPYCIVAHSHGGSVAAHALLLAAADQQPLPHLARCITVGTPYIAFAKSRWLFARSKLMEKAALVAIAAFSLFYLVFLTNWAAVFRAPSPIELFSSILLITPFLAYYLVLNRFNAKRFRIYQPAVLDFLKRTFAPRILSLRHADDEAIGTLRSLRHLRIPFFARDFAVPALSLLSLFIAPVAFIFLAQTETFLRAVDWSPFGITELKPTWYENVGSAVHNLTLGFGQRFFRTLEWIGGGQKFYPPGNPLAYVPFLGAVGMVMLALVSLPVTMLAVAGAKILSAGLAKLLNPLTWSQIRRTEFGNDTLGELTPDAGHSVAWASLHSAVLPEAIALDITQLSNASAPEALQKFRAGMNQLLLSDDKEAKEFFFSEYITWDELIHTRYFNSQRFRLLLAHAIAQTPGFRAAPALREHPEQPSFVAWWDTISKPMAARAA